RCHNQRYCQDPECLRQVRRWYAARRKARQRQRSDVKAKHAQDQKARRQQMKSVSQTIENAELAPARGHAAQTFFHSRYVIGQVATNPPPARTATRPATAARCAGRPYAISSIVNASGVLAAPWLAGSSGP